MTNLLHTTIGSNQYKDKYKVFGLKPRTWKTISIITISTLIISYASIEAKASVVPRIISPLAQYAVENGVDITDLVDIRILKVDLFLKKNNSPLAGYGEYIVGLADKYDIPWTLVVAISGKESGFGKNIKPNSYNAWGVMAWDFKGKRFIRSFRSWEEGIAFESRLLGENYRLNSIQAIGTKYCPAFECSNTWAKDVTGFQEEVNKP